VCILPLSTLQHTLCAAAPWARSPAPSQRPGLWRCEQKWQVRVRVLKRVLRGFRLALPLGVPEVSSLYLKRFHFRFVMTKRFCRFFGFFRALELRLRRPTPAQAQSQWMPARLRWHAWRDRLCWERGSPRRPSTR